MCLVLHVVTILNCVPRMKCLLTLTPVLGHEMTQTDGILVLTKPPNEQGRETVTSWSNVVSIVRTWKGATSFTCQLRLLLPRIDDPEKLKNLKVGLTTILVHVFS